MAGMSSFAQGLGSSITGNVNKAYILMHEPDVSAIDNLGATSDLGTLTGAAGGMAAISAAMSSTNSLGISSVFGMDKSIIMASKQFGYIPVKVQFNPSTITFTSQGGQIKRETVGGAGENQFQQVDIPSETVMSVELYFDDVNVMDAFMFDTLDVASVSGAYQKGKEMAGKYSVRDISELFIAAMIQSYTRVVGFVWNKMTFWGELVGANCQFTMFNKSGEPIRSKVTLQIRQDQAIKASDGTINPYATEKQWNKAFDEMFKADIGKGLLGNGNAVSNILNF